MTKNRTIKKQFWFNREEASMLKKKAKKACLTEAAAGITTAEILTAFSVRLLMIYAKPTVFRLWSSRTMLRTRHIFTELTWPACPQDITLQGRPLTRP